jgi:hypothetical protein
VQSVVLDEQLSKRQTNGRLLSLCCLPGEWPCVPMQHPVYHSLCSWRIDVSSACSRATFFRPADLADTSMFGSAHAEQRTKYMRFRARAPVETYQPYRSARLRRPGNSTWAARPVPLAMNTHDLVRSSIHGSYSVHAALTGLWRQRVT